MQNLVLAPEAYVPNKFYVPNYMLGYQEEVFGESKPQLDEESEDEVGEEQEKRQKKKLALEEEPGRWNVISRDSVAEAPLLAESWWWYILRGVCIPVDLFGLKLKM